VPIRVRESLPVSANATRGRVGLPAKAARRSPTHEDQALENAETSNGSRTPRTLGAWGSISSFLQFWLTQNPLENPERQVFEDYYAGYRRRFSPYIAHHYAEQTREITAAIRSGSSPRLLEVGAGCGTEALWFGMLGAEVTALDLESERLRVARARKEWLEKTGEMSLRVNFVDGSLLEFVTPKAFDLIWMEQAFHHIEPRQRVYPKLFDLLNPGGRLMISEANAWNVPLQLQLFARRGLKTKTHIIDSAGRRIEYGNERITTPFALKRSLEKAGFEVETIRSFRLLPNSNPPPQWLDFEKSLLGVLPFLSTHFNLVASKPKP
jgi:SAM-dependent methyltransferase